MVSEFNDVEVTGIDVKKDSKKSTVALGGGGLDVSGMVTVFTAAIIGNKKVTVVFGGSFSGSPPTDKELEQVIMPG